MFSAIFLVPAFFVDCHSLRQTISKIQSNDDLIEYIVMEAFFYLPTEIASQMVAYFSSDILGYLTNMVAWAIDILTVGSVAWKVFEIVYKILMPSVTDCIIVLYYASAEYRGVELKLCWIPTWRDKWGLSIKAR